MRIGLISDTHGYLDDSFEDRFKEVDEVWHAGDIGDLSVVDRIRAFKPSRIVFGNIDSHDIRQETEEHLFFNCEDVPVLITHIGGRPGKYVPAARDLIHQHKPKLFICGHSHILLVKNDPNNNMLCMNPGAYGFKGFHQVRTALRFTIEKDRIKDLEIVEMKKPV
jgi:putative phosphoesterase